MATASPPASAASVESGCYLQDGTRLYRVVAATEGGCVLLEDCRSLEMEHWPVKVVVAKLTHVSRS